MALIEVRLRPAGPWRVGHRTGDRERVDSVYHSDALYSAVTHAMRALGWMDEWLDATARAVVEPAVRFGSLFPFIGKTRLITPPRTLWPRPNPGKLYLEGAKLVPLEVAQGGAIDESRWQVDGSSECMIPAGSVPPFQVSMRSAAAVDRLTGATEPHRIACLEFAPNAGWWGVFDVADRAWEPRVKAAFRLLADSGFGAERSRGWGRAGSPEFSTAGSLFPNVRTEGNTSWWVLSLYSPHETDAVDWSHGEYATATRGGWTDSPSGSGPKKLARMIQEGSVLSAPSLRGQAVDVAPEGFAHPVYRVGFALAVPVPVLTPGSKPLPEPVIQNELDPISVLESVPQNEPEPLPEPGLQNELDPISVPESVPQNEPEPLPEPVIQNELDPISVPESIPQNELEPAAEPTLQNELEPPVEAEE
jgi:CRISPR/Cas system CSM-associated protein Csm4 (group 5 of RAMP superfamily)